MGSLLTRLKPRKVVALYDYKGREEDELSFNKDQIIIIIGDSSSNPEWLKGRYRADDGTKMQGYFPQNLVCDVGDLQIYNWYHPNMNRHAAELTLRQPAVEGGSFVVRLSSSTDNNPDHAYTLTCKSAETNKIHHYKIHKNLMGEFFIGNEQPAKTLPDLIKNLQKPNSNIKITNPCIRQRPTVNKITDSWEVQRDSIRLLEQIGEGNFGTVHKGERHNEFVAIKLCRPDGRMNMKEFNDETKIMKKLNHQNVIALIGVVTVSDPIYIVLEYMAKGSLGSYLRSNENIDFFTKINFAKEIACGMEYLSEVPMLHRDLAARNVLLSSSMTCKVADFGMARKGSSYQISNKRFPIKWTALEALFRGIYSTECDIWSFGVTFYEIICDGIEPYGDMKPAEVIKYIQQGKRLQVPEIYECPDYIQNLMTRCWYEDCNKRITFSELYSELCDIVDRLELQYL